MDNFNQDDNTKNKAVRASTQTASKKHHTNNNESTSRHQALYGWHGYEFMKRAFIDANPNSTASEYEQACHCFARLAGV
jgi:hypothetical protein